MKNGKVFLVNGVPRTHPPKQPSPALSVLPSMTVGAWGDPHLYVNVNSLDGQSRLQAKTIAKLGDNKAGSSGNNEIKLLDLQTATDTVKIYYTNKIWANNAKVVDSVRVEYNGASATYTNSTRVTLGPINLYILKRTVSGNDYLSFEINWSKITNITKLAGAIVVILKRVADSNGVLWNGGDGASWDGLGKAASVFGLSRSSFETGIGIQSVEDELFLSEDQANFIEIVSTDFVQDSNIFDNLENLGANGEGDGAHVSEWDDTYASIVPIFTTSNGLTGYVTDNVSLTAAPATAFSPPSSGTLSFWLDASDTTSMKQNSDGTTSVANGDPVGYISDKSGNNNHAIQASSGKRPILNTNTWNGKSVLVLDGIDDYLVTTVALDFATSKAFTISMVVSGQYPFFALKRNNGQDYASGIAIEYNNNSSGANDYPTTGGNKVKLFAGKGYSGGVGFNDWGSHAFTIDPTSGRMLISWRVKASTSELSARWNGISQTVSQLGGGSVISEFLSGGGSALHAAYVGARGLYASNDVDYTLDGKIGEIILYNSYLTDANLDIVESYLSSKWDISLPPAPTPSVTPTITPTSTITPTPTSTITPTPTPTNQSSGCGTLDDGTNAFYCQMFVIAVCENDTYYYDPTSGAYGGLILTSDPLCDVQASSYQEKLTACQALSTSTAQSIAENVCSSEGLGAYVSHSTYWNHPY